VLDGHDSMLLLRTQLEETGGKRMWPIEEGGRIMGSRLPIVQAPPALVPSVRGDVSLLGEQQRARHEGFRVALVSMPFQSNKTPSIQLGLLTAISESHGFPTDTFHLALDFAHRVGHTLYENLALTLRRMMGGWFFSKEAFGVDPPDRDWRFVDDFPADAAMQLGRGPTAELSVKDRLTILRIRNEVIPVYLNALMTDINWGQYSAIGFSCVFQQTTASVALADSDFRGHEKVSYALDGPIARLYKVASERPMVAARAIATAGATNRRAVSCRRSTSSARAAL
jgi:hypothetical protein